MSSSRDFQKRLEALNREPLPQRKKSDGEMEDIRRRIRKLREENRPPQPIHYSRDLPRREPREEGPSVPAGPPVLLEDAAAGVEVDAPRGGKAYLITERVDGRGQDWAALCKTFHDELLTQGSGMRRRLSALLDMDRLRLEDVLFMDLETTGLAGTPLFLIGTMVWEDGSLTVRQYLARDYSEERAVISIFLDGVAARKLLVSFNGKSFDLPYVRVRAAANRIPFAVSAAHFDLLHECRRVWRRVLPDCRLQTLESHICGRVRHSDIAGSEIPEAYHAFVRTGNAVQMVQILEHNRLDLATLAELMVKLPA